MEDNSDNYQNDNKSLNNEDDDELEDSINLNGNECPQNFEEFSFGELELNPLFKEFMIREAFNMFDENESGDIDKKELTTPLDKQSGEGKH